LRVFYVVR